MSLQGELKAAEGFGVVLFFFFETVFWLKESPAHLMRDGDDLDDINDWS